MKRLIFLILIFFNFVFACSLCTVYSPRTDVKLDIKADEKLIKSVKVNWTFAQAFSEELLKLYDMDLDNDLN